MKTREKKERKNRRQGGFDMKTRENEEIQSGLGMQTRKNKVNKKRR